jgi:hypothetical protein
MIPRARTEVGAPRGVGGDGGEMPAAVVRGAL